MQSGTIIHIPYKKSSSFLVNLVQKMIMRVSNSNLVHTRVYLKGWIYESTPGVGFEKTLFESKNPRYIYAHPINPMIEDDVNAQVAWWEKKLKNKAPYNYIRLFTCLLLSWTKPFWNLINYVPWSHGIFGEFCSSAVDLAFKYIGWDLIPDQKEELTAPGDLLKSQYHKIEG